MDDVPEQRQRAVVDVTSSPSFGDVAVLASFGGLDTRPPGDHHVRYDV
jgi:hypothetical protein